MDHDDDDRRDDVAIREAYEHMRILARRRLAAGGPRSIQPTDLAHQAWLRVENQKSGPPPRDKLMLHAARAMRDILVEAARARASLKRGGDWTRVDWESATAVATNHPDEYLALQQALLRLEEEDPEAADVVHLRFFVGLTGDETASTLGLGTATVDRRWAYARARLRQILEEDDSGDE